MTITDSHPSLRGLSDAEASARFARYGPNELPARAVRDVRAIVLETLREPMFVLLLGAAGLYLVLGDLAEGLFLLAGAGAAIGLVIFQETRSEQALAALRALAQPRARVLRAGIARLVPSRELVPDDIIIIGEGDRIPADALLVTGDVLSVDESLLTGESAPVTKQAHARDGGSDANAHVFAGTLVVRGQSLAQVAHTGVHSALGKIGRSLAEIDQGPTPLQKTAGRLVGLLGALALGFCVLVAIAFGLLRNDWTGGFLAGVTVAIALIPEEFPMVLAVFLALGAWRLATHKVLVRRSAIIETLGGATMLCVDKTGTLTENRMRLDRVWIHGQSHDLAAADQSEHVRALLGYAALASNVRAVDPMDRAIHEARGASPPLFDLSNAEPARSWPLRPELTAVTQLWRIRDGTLLAAAKGAPEAIFRLCRLDETAIAPLHDAVERFAADGLRVLGVAYCRPDRDFPDRPEDAAFEFAGLAGFIDPLRADVAAALDEARAAGIAVMMITGDHPATALAIARAAGIDTGAGALTGADIAALPLPTLREHLRKGRVFARVSPEQKLIIVEALKANGEIVAMTGDGVNDAPALEAAHIAIAMGRKGSDVAREAADLVLLDDGFASIVGGVRLGRRIFANLRKALTYISAVHVPIAGLALIPIVLGLPQLLFPMHVVLLELAIDPMCALVFESERSSPDAMKRPPRRADEPLFGAEQLTFALAQGVCALAGALAVYVWTLSIASETAARAAAFICLVVANLVLAFVDATGVGRVVDGRRWLFWSIAGLVLAVLAAALSIPGIAAVFRMSPPDLAIAAAAVVIGALSGAALWLPARIARVLRPPAPLQRA